VVGAAVAGNVELVPLDSVDAVASARLPGGLAVRHAIAVANAIEGIIVTRAPWQYAPGAGPLRVV
jgi:hypothetical protein